MKSAIVAELPPVRQHFFRVVCGCPRGLLNAENFGKLFLTFFLMVLAGNTTILEARIQLDGMLQRLTDALRR
jgi:hypothetical protein